MLAAISEAAFMTGLERNADVVHLATYAPLFAHVDAWQWKPDMIWFDNFSVVRTPNYYVQKMFAHNVGTNILSITSEGSNITGQDSLYASAVIDKSSTEVIVKIVNAGDIVQDINVELKGLKVSVKNNEIKIMGLHTNQPEAVNTLKAPNNIVPGEFSLFANNTGFQIKVPGNAFYVCKIKLTE
jgi:alpha-L-arabinofuranosidase